MGFGDDRHPRAIEVGEDVDREIEEGVAAVDERDECARAIVTKRYWSERRMMALSMWDSNR